MNRLAADPERERNALGAQNWHVAQLKPAGLSLARVNLTRQGFNVFCPMEPVLLPAKRGRKRQVSLRPLFPGYVFVSGGIEPSAWCLINSTMGVSRLLIGPDQGPAIISPAAMGILFSQTDEHDVLLPPEDLKPGDKVQILSGALTDWLGRIEAALPNDRYLLLFEMMGRAVRADVARGDLRRA
jgi:transcriptional antiterminator RfaH